MSVAVLTPARVTCGDVELAWATLRCLILAEVDDPALESDPVHRQAEALAKERFKRLFEQWSGQC